MQNQTLTVVLLAVGLVAPAALAQDAEPREDASRHESIAPATQPDVAEPAVHAQTAADELAKPQVRQQLRVLRREIDAMLGPGDVVPAAAEPERVRARFEGYVEQTKRIAAQYDDAEIRNEARELELRSTNVLLQNAYREPSPAIAVSHRLVQLRRSANKLKKEAKSDPAAAATADFWLLVADLVDINRNTAELPARQQQAAAKLSGYLDAYGRSPAADAEVVADVKAALAVLYDQYGRNTEAAQLAADASKQLPQTDARQQQLEQVRSRASVIGRKVQLPAGPAPPSTRPADTAGMANAEADAEADAGGDAAGESELPIIVHVFADWSEASKRPIQRLRELYAEFDGYPILSLSVGKSKLAAPDVPWPVVQLNAGDPLLKTLNVDRLPAVYLIRDGRVAAVGETAEFDETVWDKASMQLDAEATTEPE